MITRLTSTGTAGCLGLSGDPLDQGVGHDLPAAALVPAGAAGVGVRAERGIHRHALGHRQQRGQLRHRVRRRPQAHPALALGAAGAGGHRVRVEPVGDPAGLGLDLPVAPPGEPVTDLGVDRGPVLGGQAGGLAGDQHRPPLRRRTARQGREGARQLGGHDLRPAAGTAGRGRGTPAWPARPAPRPRGRRRRPVVPAATCAACCEAAKSAVTSACAAAAAAFSSSNARICSTRSASDTPRSMQPRLRAIAATSGLRSTVARPASSPKRRSRESNICANPGLQPAACQDLIQSFARRQTADLAGGATIVGRG